MLETIRRSNYRRFRFWWNNYKDNNRKYQHSETCMQKHLFRHFSSPGHNGYLNDVSITFIDKTDPSHPLKWEEYWRKTLKTMAPFGLNIEDNVWLITMMINNSVVINIYLTFRSRCCFGLFWGLTFPDNGYIYWLFLFLLHCMEWRLLLLISWWEWLSVGRQFPQIFQWKTRRATRNLGLRRISTRENWVEKLVFSAVFVYLFVYYLFNYCLFVCLLFIYFKGAVFWVMHQLCGLAPLCGGRWLLLWSCVAVLVG